MAEDETGQEPTSPQDARLTSLEERLKRAEQAEVASTELVRRAAMVAQAVLPES